MLSNMRFRDMRNLGMMDDYRKQANRERQQRYREYREIRERQRQPSPAEMAEMVIAASTVLPRPSVFFIGRDRS